MSSLGLIFGAIVMIFTVLPVTYIASVEGEISKINTGGLDQAVEDWQTPFLVDIFAIDEKDSCETFDRKYYNT